MRAKTGQVRMAHVASTVPGKSRPFRSFALGRRPHSPPDMDSRGLRMRQVRPAGQDNGGQVNDELQIPAYTVDLSQPPAHRYDHIVPDFRTQIDGLPKLFDDIVHGLHERIPLGLVKFVASLLLRRVYSDEETEELRGIGRLTGVSMYLLVAYNVLLDLFMGCTSGGVRVKESTSDPGRMLHFRTLDWGMDPLRKVVVQLNYVARPGGPILASSITYLGFVGTLTGVRQDLSLSLNFRAVHNADTPFATTRLLAHKMLVLLGFRPSIASILRQCLLPPDNGPAMRSMTDIVEQLPTTIMEGKRLQIAATTSYTKPQN
ncbi:hypothetical protein ANO11243_027300 [Dothideomycetidae sp. 11243]|nr:hypothetical protein ANO11243_027300 [fungal sp. No.11243]